MKITSENIVSISEDFEDHNDYESLAKEQYDIEIENLRESKANYVKCKFEKDLILGIDTVKLKMLYQKYFDSPEILNTIKCLIHSILTVEEGSDVSLPHKFREWVVEPKLISVGENGKALLGSIISSKEHGKAKNFIVMKIPIVYDDKDHEGYFREMVHEAYVGLNVCNILRDGGNLNFSYVYGLEVYNEMIIDDSFKDNINRFKISKKRKGSRSNQKFKVFSWALERENPFKKVKPNLQIPYIIYEKIDNIGSLSDFIEKYNYSEIHIESIYNQLFFSLAEAYEKFRFTHYDLHTDNILIKETEIKHVRYEVDGKIINVKTHGLIPVIIDYGHSVANIDGFSHGNYSSAFTEIDMLPYEGNYFNDIFKILCFGYLDTENKLFSKYFDFFDLSLKDVEKLNFVLEDMGYNLNREFTRGKTYSQFVEYLLSISHKNLIVVGEIENKRKFLNQKEIIEKIYGVPNPFSLLQLYEYGNTGIDVEKTCKRSKKSFNILYENLKLMMSRKVDRHNKLAVMTFSDNYSIFKYDFYLLEKIMKVYEDKDSLKMLNALYKQNKLRMEKLSDYVRKI